MEEIFNEPKEENKKEQIIRLRSKGISIRKIAEQMQIPKSTISDMLKSTVRPVSESVRNNVDFVRDSVRKCPNQYTLKEAKDILEQLKHHNFFATQCFNLLKQVQKKQDNIEEDYEESVNRVVNWHVKNRLGAIIDNEINKLREELKEAI